ncbi:hypothetical protein SDC9_155197 [bioreactor metagenome]|uniref:Uncharacterized protein n=1 Tax=bioreactor metagenome TaxID=1076179 RepID=A0A645F0V3_9ZZZZ
MVVVDVVNQRDSRLERQKTLDIFTRLRDKQLPFADVYAAL